MPAAKLLMFCDNQSAVLMSLYPVQHGSCKHIDIDLFFVKEKVVSGEINATHIASEYQLTDVLTKPLLPCARFNFSRDKLKVVIPP